jgi:hypothetical protein
MDGQFEREQEYDDSGEVGEDILVSKLHIVSRLNSHQ